MSSTQPYRRFPLHWVFKIGSLDETIKFYQKVFNMKIHRHEEFGSGCEATCNGPYGGAWSKTMVGYGTEITNTSLELTYNYGISSYELGNDYRYIAMSARDFGTKAAEGGFNVTPVLPGGYQVVTSPDGYRFLLVPGTTGCNPDDPFLFVSLNVTNILKSLIYYTQILGFKVFFNVPGSLGTDNSVVIGFDDKSFKIELVQLPNDIGFSHKQGIGRLAIETEDEAPATVGEIVKKSGNVILHGPFKLPPHDEHVVIVADPDGYEYCFVGQTGYRAGSLSVTNNVIDWNYRKQLNDKAITTTTNNTTTNDTTSTTNASASQSIIKSVNASASQSIIKSVKAEEFTEIIKSDKLVVIKFTASWCKPCKTLAPIFDKVAHSFKDQANFFEIDYDNSKSLVESLEITGVPTGKLYKKGVLVGGFSGLRTEDQLIKMIEDGLKK